MQIKIKLIGAFRVDRFKEHDGDYPAGMTAEKIIEQLHIPRRALGTVLINGVHSRIDDIVNEGDTIALLPILGGG